MEIGHTPLTMEAETLVNDAGVERRNKARLLERFDATVHGVNASGVAFMAETQLENISASGLYLLISEIVEPGAELLIVSKLSMPTSRKRSGPLVAMTGEVVRAVDAGDGRSGIAVKFTDTRLL